MVFGALSPVLGEIVPVLLVEGQALTDSLGYL